MTTGLRRWLAADLRWLLVTGLVLGALLKLMVILSPALGRLNSDHAVLYLMARHVSNGELPAWYWGQEYGGSLLPTVLGIVFLVTGPHLWLLSLAIGTVSTLVPVLTWRAGVALGFPSAAAVAGALVAVGPPTWLFFGIASDGFYAVGLVLSLWALVLALHHGSLSPRCAGGIGLLVGAAVWTSPLSFLTTLPVAAVLLPRLWRAPARLLPLAAGLAVGAFPVLQAAVRRGTLLPPQFHNDDSIGHRVEAATTGTWAAVFTRFGPHQVPSWLVDRLAVAALLVAVAAGLVSLYRLGTGRRDVPTAALLLPVVLWIPFHVRAYLPSDAPASRYGLPLLPFLALWAVRWLRTTAQAALAVAVLALYSAAGLWQAVGGPSAPGSVLHNRSYALLAQDLTAHGRTAVLADYWISYRLTAETDERIVAEPPSLPRRPAYYRAALSAPQTTAVVFADQATDVSLAQRFAGDPGVQRVVVAQFAVYYADRQVQLPGFGGTFDIDRP